MNFTSIAWPIPLKRWWVHAAAGRIRFPWPSAAKILRGKVVFLEVDKI